MKAVFHIEDMHCNKCSSIILKSIENISGIHDIKVDIDSRKLNIDISSKALIENIKLVIEDCGFLVNEVELN